MPLARKSHIGIQLDRFSEYQLSANGTASWEQACIRTGGRGWPLHNGVSASTPSESFSH